MMTTMTTTTMINGQLIMMMDCCTDDDECDRSRGQVCPQNSRCENTHGSFRCIC